MAIAAASLMCHVAPRDRLLLNCVEAVAETTDRPTRPLHLQALLQLPRLSDQGGMVALGAVEELLTELTQELPDKAEWFVREAGRSPRLFEFHKVESSKARDVMQKIGRAHV